MTRVRARRAIRPGSRKIRAQLLSKYSGSTIGRGSRFLASGVFNIGTPEKIGGFDSKDAREPVDHVDAGRIDASFEGANIGAVDLRAMRQLFLGQAARASQLPQIERQYLSYVHAREGSVLKSILPRSILDNRIRD